MLYETVGIWPNEPYFFRGGGEMAVVLMHTVPTYCGKTTSDRLIKIPLLAALEQTAKLGNTMNIINTKDVPTRLASPYSAKYRHMRPLTLPKDESSNWSPSY